MKLAVSTLALMLLGAGPISKFDDHPVSAEYDTATPMWDVERCLIDQPVPSIAQVYYQPDRPDSVMILWVARGPLSEIVGWRIDLTKTPAGTHVLSWFPKMAEKCAPRTN